MTNEEIIEEILIEAYSYGLRDEVMKMATNLLMLNPRMDRCCAYEEAFQKITNGQD
jgi:hypothetical protein